MLMNLEGKTCIVTGGASGLGLEIVRQLKSEKSKPVILDINPLPEGVAAQSDDLTHYRCDVTDERQVEATVKQVVSDAGDIDVLVNNVGILYSAPLVSFGRTGFETHDSLMWDKVLATNLSSAFYMTKHVVEAMLRKRTRGVIVNISSISAKGNAGQSAYAAAKAGLESLTKVWAKELPPMGIRCFGVAPGFCNTDSTHSVMNDRNLQETVNRVPLKRLGNPEEIAAFVIAGIRNDFLNGKILEVDGGLVV